MHEPAAIVAAIDEAITTSRSAKPDAFPSGWMARHSNRRQVDCNALIHSEVRG